MCDGEFLFVDPVGGAVDYLVQLAVGGDGVLLERGEVHPVEVVVAHKGHLRAVGTQGGQALLTVVAYLGEGLLLDVIDVVVAHAAVAVERLEARAEQNLLLVGTHLVALERGEGLDFLLLVGTAEEADVLHLLTGQVAILGDANAGHREVVLAVGHRTDAADAAGREGTLGPNVLQRDIVILSCDGATGCHCCKCHNHKEFLHYIIVI